MCVIYHVDYEFNNWKAMLDTYKFIQKRHGANYPRWRFEVPIRFEGVGWDSLKEALIRLNMDYLPEDTEEMSVYGWFRFYATKDENLNNEYWRNK